MPNKVSKTPMCCGPVCDGEAMYLCMAPATVQCYCGKCDKFYACDTDKDAMNKVHIKQYGCAARWRPFALAIQAIR